jgi:hypothetical protein
MNKKQAIAEARRRWGDRADVRKDSDKHKVGWMFADIGFSVEGQGATWEAAFEAADVRAKHAPEFLERVREALRVMRGDDVSSFEEGWVRDVLGGQAEFDKSLQRLVDHLRGICAFGRQHHAGATRGLDALEGFTDIQERRLRAFTTRFPPVPTLKPVRFRRSGLTPPNVRLVRVFVSGPSFRWPARVYPTELGPEPGLLECGL